MNESHFFTSVFGEKSKNEKFISPKGCAIKPLCKFLWPSQKSGTLMTKCQNNMAITKRRLYDISTVYSYAQPKNSSLIRQNISSYHVILSVMSRVLFLVLWGESMYAIVFLFRFSRTYTSHCLRMNYYGQKIGGHRSQWNSAQMNNRHL